MAVKKFFVFSLCFLEGFSVKICGIANSASEKVYEGRTKIEIYPWLGFLYYQIETELYSTAVVLVSRQIALATAAEIDALPKFEFRARARVVLGSTCKEKSIGIREYTYHPEYFKGSTITTICVIQLETDNVDYIELRPICQPPPHFNDPIFYAMVPPHNCLKSTVMIYKMEFVPMDQCKMYYRRNGLDVESFWPAQTVCARSLTGGTCVWRSGAILTVKSANRWRLLGFGVYGPGCSAPARFLDYGTYHSWVRNSVARIGRPSITFLADNHLVLRRMSSKVQRFGTCDYEETMYELYADRFILYRMEASGTYKYNMSLYENIEYSCIILKASTDGRYISPNATIRLRNWCAGDRGFCSGPALLSIHFYLEIKFATDLVVDIHMYGTEVSLIDVNRVHLLINTKISHRNLTNFTSELAEIKKIKYKIPNWYKPSSILRRTDTDTESVSSDEELDIRGNKGLPVMPDNWSFNITTEKTVPTDNERLRSVKYNIDNDKDRETNIDDQISSSLDKVTEKPVKTLFSAKRPLIVKTKSDSDMDSETYIDDQISSSLDNVTEKPVKTLFPTETPLTVIKGSRFIRRQVSKGATETTESHSYYRNTFL